MSQLEIAVKVADVCFSVVGSATIKSQPILDGFVCCATKECPHLSVYASALGPPLSA